MADRKYPQVLLLGNGLNMAYTGKSWGNVIQELWCNPRVCKEDKMVQQLPYPLQAVLATDDSVDASLKNYSIDTITDSPELTKILQSLLCTGFDHILTTNYTYELEAAASADMPLSDGNIKKLMAHTSRVTKAESKYLLHTYNRVSYAETENKIWHIHGEARKQSSIVLGHYYYGKLLSKYCGYLNNGYQQKRQREGKPPMMGSWLDAFIMGDVYVLGFSCHFSEMDLWWLINRKKNEKADHGKVYFYEPEYGNEMKHALLDTYDVEVRNLGYRTKKVNYKAFYQAAIADVHKLLAAK